MKKSCIYCGAPIHESAAFCHSCARSQIEKQRTEVPRPWRRKVGSVLLAVLIVAALLTAGSFLLREQGEMTGEEHLSGLTASQPDQPAPAPAEEPAEEPSPMSEPAEEPGPDPEPAPAQEPEPAYVPRTLVGEEGALVYGAYHLSLSFSQSNGEVPPSDYDDAVEFTIFPGIFVFSQIFVTTETGAAVQVGFLADVLQITVSAGDKAGNLVETSEPLANEEDPLALRAAKVFFPGHTDTITVSWTLTMNNGDILVLRHRLTVLTEPKAPEEPYISAYLTEEDCFLRKRSDEELSLLMDADAATLQAEISTVADAVAYLDLFPHGMNTFFSALNSDFIPDAEYVLKYHRSIGTGPDTYTVFTGWCLADDYPEARYLVASGDSHGFAWVYHGLLLHTAEGWYVVSPAGHSLYWNAVYGFEEMKLSTLDDLENTLVQIHAGMADSSGLFLYHVFTAGVTQENLSFYLTENYLSPSEGAVEHYRRPEE